MANIYSTLDAIFEKFNVSFNDALGGMIDRESFVFTLQRKTNVICKAKYQSFENTIGDHKHEIAVNPEYLSVKPKIEILKALCQELLVLYRYHHGDPETRQIDLYDEEWGEFMMVMGLMPSNTGKPDGKETGKKMSSYIMGGKGNFIIVCEELADLGLLIDWFDKVPKKYEVDDIIAELFEYRENYDLEEWDKRLLEIPVLQRKGIDVISLIENLGVDDTSKKIEIQGEVKKKPVVVKPTTEQLLESIDDDKGYEDSSDGGTITKNVPVDDVESFTEIPLSVENDVDEFSNKNDNKVFSSTFEPDDDRPKNPLRNALTALENIKKTSSFEDDDFRPNNTTKDVVSSKEEIALLIGMDTTKPEPRKRTVFVYRCGCEIEITAKSPSYSITCDKCELKFRPIDVDYEVGVVHN